MKALWEKFKTAFRHNQAFAVAVVACIIVAVWMFGCESRVANPFDPEAKVTREQLSAEVDAYNRQVELAYADLTKQDLFKAKLSEIGMAVAQGGTVDPVGAGVTLLALLGIGAAVDNRKKDSIIKTLKNGNGTTTTETKT